MLFFYVCFAFQNIFDATFYGAGKINYMLFKSVITNSIYYGAFFIAYKTGAWIPSLTGIALMFGFGNMFDSVISGFVYWYFRKNQAILPKVFGTMPFVKNVTKIQINTLG